MLSIIIVNYKNEDKTISYVRNELNDVLYPHIIVIVNNAGTEFSNNKMIEKLNGELITDINIKQKLNKKIYIISHSENLGFAKGNNLGVDFSNKHFSIEYFLFSNNDIRIKEKNTISLLLNKLKTLPNNISVIGPAVKGLDGKNQSPIIYISFLKKWFTGLWITPILNKKLQIIIYGCDRENIPEGICYSLMGSFILVKAKDFLDCGMFDPNTFLFGEECILSERLALSGKKMYYYPKTEIIHEHSQTISKHHNNLQKRKLMFQSDIYYYKTYKKLNKLNIWFCWNMIKLHQFLKSL